jgi:hypothetical protein
MDPVGLIDGLISLRRGANASAILERGAMGELHAARRVPVQRSSLLQRFGFEGRRGASVSHLMDPHRGNPHMAMGKGA